MKQQQVPARSKALAVQLLIRSGLFLQRELNQACQSRGFSANQFAVINEICLHGPLSQKKLCERLLFEKSNISKIVKSLLDRSLISITVAPADRRMTLLIETPEGGKLWKECMESFYTSSDELMAFLSDAETTKVIQQLKKLETAFKAISLK